MVGLQSGQGNLRNDRARYCRFESVRHKSSSKSDPQDAPEATKGEFWDVVRVESSGRKVQVDGDTLDYTLSKAEATRVLAVEAFKYGHNGLRRVPRAVA